MKRHELLAETVTPDGMRMTLSLHAGNYYIDVENQALMSTRAPGSERALGMLAGRELHGQKKPRVMIGSRSAVKVDIGAVNIHQEKRSFYQDEVPENIIIDGAFGDWMQHENRLYPAMANDDAHAGAADDHDTFQCWTWVRVKERTREAIFEALVRGASYSSTGPEIHDIRLRRMGKDGEGSGNTVEVTVRCSQSRRIMGVADSQGAQYWEHGNTFEKATFNLYPGARWTRFEIIGPDGSKAWSNPFDLTALPCR